ncbi:Bcr/CflA family drug resistance efflux transporter [Zobellella denitrificans]|uniref:multidrug effflux MFS transporter n=1 Tax=Zobellella denitrificans TaxID=347534 RepID=UPI000B8C0676|nr:multidrug effflux MFS transporter [Zobellella denitrificans]OXS14828.1 Bcr/CflA family drug resistance efflux transporter [Zobellella denitrificans]
MTQSPVISLVLLLLPLILFGPMGIDIYLPAMPQMAISLGVSAADIQLSLSVFMLAVGLGQLVFGPLVDNKGRRPVALCAIGLFFTGSLVSALAAELPLLLLGRLIQGLGACGTSVVVFAVVRDKLDAGDSARAYSYLNGALCLAPALAPVLGAWLTLSFGWQANCLFLALFATLALVLVMARLRESRPAHTRHQPLLSPHAYQAVWRHRAFRVYVLTCVAAMGSILTYVTFAPLILMVQLGLSEAQFALAFGANALVVMAASFSAPRLSRRLGRHRVVKRGALCLLGGGLAMLLWLPSAPSVWSFMLPVALCSVGFSLVLGAAAASAMAPFADRAGRAAALLGCLQMAGAATASYLASLLPLSPGEACALTIMLLAALALLSLNRLPREQRRLADADA